MLTPGGRLIVSVDHPIVFKLVNPGADYFATRQWSFEWTFGGHTALMTFWHRPLHAMSDAFTAAGFKIAVISEPDTAPDTPLELFPPEFGGRARFLGFLFFVLEAV